MENTNDIFVIVFAVALVSAGTLFQIAIIRFRRQIVKKQHVDRGDEIQFWRSGRAGYILGAVAFCSLALDVLETIEHQLPWYTRMLVCILSALFGVGILLMANATMVYGTRYSLWWRKRLFGSKSDRNNQGT